MKSTQLKNKNIEAASALENEDILQHILTRLSANSFASAACVSKSWNRICTRILSRPKLTSALSLNSSLQVAVGEVLEKVLSEPIRPHFAICFVGLNYNLAVTLRLITRRLGSNIPIIINAADGLIGKNARSDVIGEVKWKLVQEDHHVPYNSGSISNLVRNIDYCGIVLAVGCVPGLKVEAIPLLRSRNDDSPRRGPRMEMIDNFLTDIQVYTSTVSNCTSPEAIIMFGDQRVDLKPVLVRMDNMPVETVIVGSARGCFLCQSGGNAPDYPRDSYSVDAVSLVFVKKSSNDGGNYQFSIAQSNGLVPFGPQCKVGALIVVGENYTWLTTTMAGHRQILNTRGLCRAIREEIEDKNPRFYIGVTHRREHFPGSRRSHLAYYKILREVGDYGIVVDGVGIKRGDSFVFCHTDCNAAFDSMINACDELENLTAAPAAASTSHSSNERQIFGGLIFSCLSRGEPGFHIFESLPFHANFPSSALAGLFCRGEIARVSTELIMSDDEEDDNEDGGEDEENPNSGGCFVHYDSTTYIVMSYTPPR